MHLTHRTRRVGEPVQQVLICSQQRFNGRASFCAPFLCSKFYNTSYRYGTTKSPTKYSIVSISVVPYDKCSNSISIVCTIDAASIVNDLRIVYIFIVRYCKHYKYNIVTISIVRYCEGRNDLDRCRPHLQASIVIASTVL